MLEAQARAERRIGSPVGECPRHAPGPVAEDRAALKLTVLSNLGNNLHGPAWDLDVEKCMSRDLS